MLTKKIANFSDDLLNTVLGILGEAKKHDKDCECEKCEAEDEMKEGAMPTADEPTEANKKTAQKVRDLLAKEKKPVKEDAEQIDETAKIVAHLQKRYGDNIRKSHVRSAANDFGVDASKLAKAVRTKLGKNMLDEEEQIDEISKAMVGRYINKAKNSIDLTAWRQGYKEAGAGSPSKHMEKKLSKRHKGIETAVKKLTKEESENLDELSKATMGRYINKAATKMGSQGVTAGLKIAADEKSSKNFKDMGKREKGIKLAVNKLTKEEQDFVDSLNDADLEQIDELSKKTLGSYIKKASGAEKPKNVMSPKNVPLTKIAAYQGDSETGHFGKRFNQATYDKAERLHKNRSQGITRAADKLAKEEVEVIDELSKSTLGSYVKKAKNQLSSSDYHVGRAVGAREAGQSANFSKELEKKLAARGKKRYHGIDKAVGKMTKEEVELDEARGRPKKAGAKDFTIHPKTKEKLMHNNPEHMAKIERLQKNKVLEKPKVEAGQHIMNQLQKAKTSMLGGSTIHFTHGDSKHVSGTHAAKLLSKYAGMKPNEKEDFQKKIGHSHEQLMKHV